MSNHISRKDAAALALVLTVASKACPKADNGEMLKNPSVADVQSVRWIPVEEQMPEMHDAGILKMLGIQQMSEKVLLAILNEEEAIVDNDAELRDGEWYSDTLRLLKAGGKAFTVTHWMPLPEPPKKGV